MREGGREGLLAVAVEQEIKPDCHGIGDMISKFRELPATRQTDCPIAQNEGQTFAACSADSISYILHIGC